MWSLLGAGTPTSRGIHTNKPYPSLAQKLDAQIIVMGEKATKPDVGRRGQVESRGQHFTSNREKG